MQPSDTDSLDALSAGELRGLIGRLLSEVSALRSAVQTLQELNTALRGEVATLSAENRTLKDEIARLKELPARPPSKPSGMDRSTEAGRVSKEKRARSRRRRGPTLPRITITNEVVLTAAAPAGSRFKGYALTPSQRFLGQDCGRSPRPLALPERWHHRETLR